MKYSIEKIDKMICDWEQDDDFIITTSQIRDGSFQGKPHISFTIYLKNDFNFHYFHTLICDVLTTKIEVVDYLNNKGHKFLKYVSHESVGN